MKEGRVLDTSGLDDLGHAVGQDVCGQGGKSVGIGQDQAGRPEGPDQVFPLRDVHAGFPPHRGVYLREEGGGKTHKIDPPQPGGGGKAGHVSRHAAAKGGNQVGTGQTVGGQLFIECGDGGQPFRLFPGGEDEPGHAISCGGVALSHGVGIQGRDVGI